MVVFSTVHDRFNAMIEKAFDVTEGPFRLGELVLSIFSFIEAANRTIPIGLKNSVNYLANFVGIYRSLFQFKCTKAWFNKNNYGERYWKAECWQSTTHLVFITAMAILDIPNFLDRFQIKLRLLSTASLGFIPIIVEFGSHFFGTWRNLNEIFRIEKKTERIRLLENLWIYFQNNDLKSFEKAIPLLASSLKNSRIETPQDHRDIKALKKEMKVLINLRNATPVESSEACLSKHSKKWQKLLLNMELTKKIAWAIIGIHIANGLMVALRVISFSSASNTARFGIPTMELINAIFGLRFYHLKCAF